MGPHSDKHSSFFDHYTHGHIHTDRHLLCTCGIYIYIYTRRNACRLNLWQHTYTCTLTHLNKYAQITREDKKNVSASVSVTDSTGCLCKTGKTDAQKLNVSLKIKLKTVETVKTENINADISLLVESISNSKLIYICTVLCNNSLLCHDFHAFILLSFARPLPYHIAPVLL